MFIRCFVQKIMFNMGVCIKGNKMLSIVHFAENKITHIRIIYSTRKMAVSCCYNKLAVLELSF